MFRHYWFRAALGAAGLLLLPVVAWAATHVQMETQANRRSAAAGNTNEALIIVTLENDGSAAALRGAAIDDAVTNLPINDDPAANSADTPGFHFKNPAGGAPPGASFMTAIGMFNFGDGVYAIRVTPGAGVWASGNYVYEVRLVAGTSATHGADLNGIAKGKLVIP